MTHTKYCPPPNNTCRGGAVQLFNTCRVLAEFFNTRRVVVELLNTCRGDSVDRVLVELFNTCREKMDIY